MREIAAIAQQSGHSQQTLATLMGYSPPAILKHFTIGKPRWETVKLYAERLRIPQDYLGLLCEPTEPLSKADKQRWLRNIMAELKRSERERQRYKPGTVNAVAATLKKLDSTKLDPIIEAFVVASSRARQGLTSSETSFDALEEAFKPHYDLRARRWIVQPGEDLLFTLWLFMSATILTPEELEKLIDYTSLLLKSRGIDTVPMYKYLRANEYYLESLKKRRK
jgi:hypothetical protein